MEQGGACRRSAPFRCAKPRWPVTGPTGAAILPSPSRLRRAGAPTAKTRRLSGFIRPPFRLRRNRAGRSSAPPFGFAAQKRARHFAARDPPVRPSASRPRLRRPAPLFCCCRFLQFSRSYARLLVFNSVFAAQKPAQPVVAPTGGNVLAPPIFAPLKCGPAYSRGVCRGTFLCSPAGPALAPRRLLPFGRISLRETAQPVVAPAFGRRGVDKVRKYHFVCVVLSSAPLTLSPLYAPARPVFRNRPKEKAAAENRCGCEHAIYEL